VWLQQLRLENFRLFRTLEIELSPGLHFFVGPNGAGKTSILEAVYLLSNGRSFRTFRHERLPTYGFSDFSIFAQLKIADESVRRLGMQRADDRWQSRIDGMSVPALSSLLQACAVVCFEPGSHALISGTSEERRRFLDWGLFHVEQEFAFLSRKFKRSLKQRNALLKQKGIRNDALESWNYEFVQTGEKLAQLREIYLKKFESSLQQNAQYLINELGEVELKFYRGWNSNLSLQEALEKQIQRDLALGHTSVGPHRADWEISFRAAPRREHLSRGQEKLCALACMLSQVQIFYQHKNEYPIICLDDFASELDSAHQATLMKLLESTDAQLLITGTHLTDALRNTHRSLTMFHVERGQVQCLV